MELLELYKEENRDILYSISWLNKNSIFDKSIGGFQDIDLFTFLENINQYDYTKDTFYDDFYYILEYTEDTILHIIKNINREIKRKHRVMPISQAKEFDRESILWLSRKNGRTIKEKLSNGKIKAVERYSNIDTYENRIFKILLKKLVLIYEERDDLKEFDTLFIKIRKWLKSDESKSIDEYKKIVYNNILLHHKHYNKIFKSYKWLNRLNEKVKEYKEIYPEQIKSIIKFEILTQLQFYTVRPILPSNLNIKRDNFKLEIDIEGFKIKTSSIKEKDFIFIRNFAKGIVQKQLKMKLNENRNFLYQEIEDDLFIDIFKLSPIFLEKQLIKKFPILIKEDNGNKKINANNTKVINLNHSNTSITKSLYSYNENELSCFLEDIKSIFSDNYIRFMIPDFINSFDFIPSRRVINNYFKNSAIPKSVVIGMEYIFNNKVKKNDTLLVLQEDNRSNIYVTPLLVRYDNKLQSITNGLYLERHPTKNISKDKNVLNQLENLFDKEMAMELLNTFGKEGLEELQNRNVYLYIQDELKNLKLLKFILSKQNIDKVKTKFKSKKLFQKKAFFIEEKKELLNTYEQIVRIEKNGIKLWQEHLPNLSMEIIRNGYFDNFILVNDKTKVINKTIAIKESFTIPKDIDELSFPLVFDNKKNGYIAYLKSKEFPCNQNVECRLELIYDYESEDVYQLNFIPLNKTLSSIKVKWKKEKEKEIKKLIFPQYPQSIKVENDVEEFIIKELKTLLKNLELIESKRFDETRYFFLKSGRTKAYISKYWQNGNSTKNKHIKSLIKEILVEFLFMKDDIPRELKNNIFLFLSYIHKDLIINNKKYLFIIHEFSKKEHLNGLSVGCLNTDWQKIIFEKILDKKELTQIKVLNIALWRCKNIVNEIDITTFEKLLKFIEKKLKFLKNEKELISYLEFLLASLRTKNSSELLHPNKPITKEILNILKNRSKYFVENYELKSKINFGKIDKPDNLSKMPDILYAVIYYLSNEDIENKIIINEVTS